MTEPEPEGGMTSLKDIEVARAMNSDAEFEEQAMNLRIYLDELRRIAAMKKDLEKEYIRYTALAMPALRVIGSCMHKDPISGDVIIANVRQSQTLKVNAGELYDALLEQYDGDIDQAEMVWKMTLKAPEVDTKDEGRFHEATKERPDNQPAWISAETIAKVAQYKESAAYVGFAKPGG